MCENVAVRQSKERKGLVVSVERLGLNVSGAVRSNQSNRIIPEVLEFIPYVLGRDCEFDCECEGWQKAVKCGKIRPSQTQSNQLGRFDYARWNVH